jgi:hypothetical protein
MKNIVINELLTKDSIILLKNIVNLELNRKDIWVNYETYYSTKNSKEFLQKNIDTVGVIKTDFARTDLRNLEIPIEIINEISDKLIENKILNYQYIGKSTAMLYNKNLGNPKLTEHIDSTEHKDTIMVDYQLESNTNWALSVEGKDYTLLDNQALIFCGNQQKHSRKFKKFNDNEFITNIIFRFNPYENTNL